jgi:hypothetical protein
MSEKKSSSGMVGAETGSSPYQKPQGILILYREAKGRFALAFLELFEEH